MSTELLSAPEAARYLGISHMTILRLSGKGFIKSVKKTPVHRYFQKTELDNYLKRINSNG